MLCVETANAAETTAMIFVILLGAEVFNAFLALGPVAWAERREERYRAAPLLRRAAALGRSLRD